MKTNLHYDKKPKTGLQKKYFNDGKLSSVGKYENGKKQDYGNFIYVIEL